MSDPIYALNLFDVSDKDEYLAYSKRSAREVQAHGGRVIALGEVGELPKLEILAAQPKWAWFMVWASWLETHNTLERVMTIYNSQETLTREELDLHK